MSPWEVLALFLWVCFVDAGICKGGTIVSLFFRIYCKLNSEADRCFIMPRRTLLLLLGLLLS